MNTEDSSLVPQNAQVGMAQKIRTLTAAELDRLTIDGDGRFYWDGHLVNYQPPQALQPTPLNLRNLQRRSISTLALLDRAALAVWPSSRRNRAGTQVTSEVAPEVQPMDASVVAITTLAPVAAVRKPRRPSTCPTARRSTSSGCGCRSGNRSAAVVVLALLVGAVNIAVVAGIVATRTMGLPRKTVSAILPAATARTEGAGADRYSSLIHGDSVDGDRPPEPRRDVALDTTQRRSYHAAQ